MLAVGVAVAMAACTSVRRIQPAEYLDRHAPDVVWVSYGEHMRVPLAAPQIIDDTLMGLRPATKEPLAIPLDQVSTVHARTHNGLKTALLLGTVGVGVASSMYVLWISKAGPEGKTIDCANDGVDEHPEEHPECF
jgi:hypothetical protein